MVSPHFPPDTSAATHRVRLLAPHLADFGWEPTILTVEPSAYEGRLDRGVESLVDPGLRVVRAPAWRAGSTRKFGIGDLGLRAFSGLRKKALDLFKSKRFDVVFITTYPIYPALLGPFLKKRFSVPFVLDYQDPWVGAWGKTVGPGSGRKPNLKSRVSRLIASRLEKTVAGAADAITAVSEKTYADVQERNPSTIGIPTQAIPLGGESRDFEKSADDSSRNQFFDPTDGLFHLCYVGTLLPLGVETLTAVLDAIRSLNVERPEIGKKVRAYFLGTSNQSLDDQSYLVKKHAEEFGISGQIVEHPARIDYLDAIAVQSNASAVLLMGSTEHHYTASKLYPALLSRRPLLAVFHEQSSVTTMLRSLGQPERIHLITYNDSDRAKSRRSSIAEHLAQLVQQPRAESVPLSAALPYEYSARRMAELLAAVFDKVIANGVRK